MSTLDERAGFAPPSEVPDCPYRGLMSYTEGDAVFFFGREQDTRLIVDNLRAYPLSVLYGPSGVGKSSLLQAGVLAMLSEENERRHSLFGDMATATAYCSVWSDDPEATLATKLSEGLERASSRRLSLPSDRLDAGGLIQSCDELNLDLLVILDQFEEYFLYHPDDGDRFGRELARLLVAGSRISLLIAIREDALAKLDLFEAALPGIFSNTLRLEHLDEEEAREAVVKPLERFNAIVPDARRREIEPALVQSLLEQVRAGTVSVASHASRGGLAARSAVGRTDIEAPFLQLVLLRLWEEETAQGSRVLRLTTLQRLGGAESIVREHLDRVVAEIPATDHLLLARIFRHLVTPGGTKIAHTAADLAALVDADERQVEMTLHRLCEGDQRILRELPPPAATPDGPPRYEVFHDVLALAVNDWRRRWMREWEGKREQDALLRQKEEAEREANATRRRLRRARTQVAVLAAVVAVGLVLALLAGLGQARHARLLSEARLALDADKNQSTSAALAAWRSWPHSAASEEVLRRSMEFATLERNIRVSDQQVVSSTLTNDGNRVLTASEDGHIRIFDLRDGRLVNDIDVGSAAGVKRLTSASFGADGESVIVPTVAGKAVLAQREGNDTPQVLTTENMSGQVEAFVSTDPSNNLALTFAYDGRGAQLWDLSGGALVHQLDPSGTSVQAAAIDHSGEHVVTWGADRRIRVWSTSTGRRLAMTRMEKGPIGLHIDFAPETGVLVAVDGYRRVWTWDYRDDEANPQSVVQDWFGSSVHALEIYPDGKRIVVAGDKLWTAFRLEGQEPNDSITWRPDARSAIVKTAIHPRAPLIASAGDDGRVQVHFSDRRNNEPLVEFVGHRGRVNDIAFTDDGSRLVTAGSEGTVRVWQLPFADSDMVVAWDEPKPYVPWRHAASFDDSGKIWAGSSNGTISLIDSASGDEDDLATPVGIFPLHSLDPRPDGTAAVVGGAWSEVPVVVARDGTGSPTFTKDARWFMTVVRWSPAANQDLIVGGFRANLLYGWSSSGGRHRWKVALGAQQANDHVIDLEFSADGESFVSVSTDGQLRLHSVDQDGQVTDSLPVGLTTNVAVSEDGRWAVTSGIDQSLKLWDLQGTAEPVREFQGPTAGVAEVAFSKDDAASRVAAVGADGFTYVWDRESGKLLAALRRHGDFVNSVDFDPDNPSRLATASDDGTVAIYPCTPCDLEGDKLTKAAERLLPHR